MRELGRVFANEWMKLMYRCRLWVTLLLGALVIFGLTFLGYKSHQSNQMYHSLEGRQQQINQLEQELKSLQQQRVNLEQNKELSPEEIKKEAAYLEETISSIEEQIVLEKDELKRNQILASDDWKSIIREDIAKAKEEISQKEKEIKESPAAATTENKANLSWSQHHLKTLEYSLNNNIQPLPSGMRSTFQEMNDLIHFTSRVLLPMLVVILIADMVSGETTSGTIKLLLVRPVSRMKILMGKWLVSLLATSLLTIGFYFFMFAANTALYGTAGMDQPTTVNVYHLFEMVQPDPNETPYLMAFEFYDKASIIPMWQYILSGIGLTIISMMAVATITFFCSTIFKSSMVSTGVAFASIIVGEIIVLSVSNGKYIFWLFSLHFNLLENWSGALSTKLGMNLSLGDGMIILGCWTLIAIIPAILYFTRRDVLNA